MTEKITKVLFDTDIGSDIDDAVALAYLLANRNCELVGITTVSGQPAERAKLASAICKSAGMNIPIVPGLNDRIDGPTRQPDVPQKIVLSNWNHDNEFNNIDAVEFMAETIRENPNEVSLLAVGPMTNVANLFTRHPDTPNLLKSLQLMIGRFSDKHGLPISEWNAHCDPSAASVVYSTITPKHTSIGLDVTYQVVMSSTEVKHHFQHPILKPVYEMSKVWFESREEIRFHDPLAAVTLFDDSICTYVRGRVNVLRSGDRSDGQTQLSDDYNGPHRVGITVNSERFFESYFSVFNQA